MWQNEREQRRWPHSLATSAAQRLQLDESMSNEYESLSLPMGFSMMIYRWFICCNENYQIEWSRPPSWMEYKGEFTENGDFSRAYEILN